MLSISLLECGSPYFAPGLSDRSGEGGVREGGGGEEGEVGGGMESKSMQASEQPRKTVEPVGEKIHVFC